ncbi:MAG: hypothetical protein AABY27_03205 [Pseudomonadota bacterium]
MAITNEQVQYFNDAIQAVFEKRVFRNTALDYIVTNADLNTVLAELNDLLGQDFIATASALGIHTPQSIINKSNSDVSRIHAYTGYTSPTYGETSVTQKIAEDVGASVKTIQTQIGDTTYLGLFQTPTIMGGLKELSEGVNEIASITGIDIAIETKNLLSNYGIAEYEVTSTPKTITRCIPTGNNQFTLGSVVATGDKKLLGIIKAMFDCSAWANEINDHYFTTGTAEQCSVLIPESRVFTMCLSGLNINVEKLLPS